VDSNGSRGVFLLLGVVPIDRLEKQRKLREHLVFSKTRIWQSILPWRCGMSCRRGVPIDTLHDLVKYNAVEVLRVIFGITIYSIGSLLHLDFMGNLDGDQEF
jgi:hypothetical protein